MSQLTASAKRRAKVIHDRPDPDRVLLTPDWQHARPFSDARRTLRTSRAYLMLGILLRLETYDDTTGKAYGAVLQDTYMWVIGEYISLACVYSILRQLEQEGYIHKSAPKPRTPGVLRPEAPPPPGSRRLLSLTARGTKLVAQFRRAF